VELATEIQFMFSMGQYIFPEALKSTFKAEEEGGLAMPHRLGHSLRPLSGVVADGHQTEIVMRNETG
jgi:hypothetical protein